MLIVLVKVIRLRNNIHDTSAKLRTVSVKQRKMSDRDKLQPHSKGETRAKEENTTESKHDDPPPPYPGIPGADITSDTAPLMSPRQQPQMTQPHTTQIQDQPKFPSHVQPTHFSQPSAPSADAAPYPNTQGPQLQGPDVIQPKPYPVNPHDHGILNPLSTNSAPYPNTQGLPSQPPYLVQPKPYPIDDKSGRYTPLSANSAPYTNNQGPQLQKPYPIQQPPYPVNQSGAYVPLTTHEGYPVYVHQPAVMAPVYGPARRQADDDCNCSECLGVTLVCCEFTRCLVECCTCLAEISK